MKPFWTVTNHNTTHTNDRSQRFETEQAAIHEATTRIRGNRADAVFVLKAVKLIQLANQPIEITEIE